MGKVKQSIMLNPAQVAIAKSSGMDIEEYAKKLQTLFPTTVTVFNPNKHPAYSIPLSELANLWRARYGDMWVDVSELDGEFWEEASQRLHQNKMMEEVNHHSDTTPWSRLKEGV
jgi:hypothetical protein